MNHGSFFFKPSITSKDTISYTTILTKFMLCSQILIGLAAIISIKIHYLHIHLDRFPESQGDLSEEQSERFHQYINMIEERYQGRGTLTRWQNTAGTFSKTIQTDVALGSPTNDILLTNNYIHFIWHRDLCVKLTQHSYLI